MKIFSYFSKSNKEAKDKNITPKDTYHTYFTDVLKKKGDFDEGAVARKLREDRLREQLDLQQKKEKRALIAWISLIIFLFAGSFFVVISVQRAIMPEPVRQAEAVNSYIRADAYGTLDLNDFSSLGSQIKSAIKNPSRSRTFSVLVLKSNGRNFSSSNLGSLLGWSLPEKFYQTVSPFFTYGWYFKGQEKVAPFLIFKINSFNDFQISISDWDKTLVKDLSSIFSFGWSDKRLAELETQVELKLLNNREIKILKIKDENNQEEVLIAYTIIDNKYLVFSTDSSVLTIIAKRFTDLN